MAKREQIVALAALFIASGCNAINGGGDRWEQPPSVTPATSASARGRILPWSSEPTPVPITPPPTRDPFDGPPIKGVPLKDSPATTNAAMAAGLNRGSASDLRIPKEDRRRQPEAPLEAPARASDQPWSAPAAPMSDARPVNNTTVSASNNVNPATADGPKKGAPIRSVEEGKKRVADLGGLAPRFDQLPTGEWQFSCLIPNPKNVNVHRRYEVRDRDQLKAIQAVLDQVDLDHK